MGNCVGERNMRFFAAFLGFAGIGMLLLTLLAIHRLAELRCFSEMNVCGETWEPFGIFLAVFFFPTPDLPSALAVLASPGVALLTAA